MFNINILSLPLCLISQSKYFQTHLFYTIYLYTPLSLLLQFEYFASFLISFNFVLKMISKSILQFTIIIICHLFVFVCFFITIRMIVLFNFP